jgi:hypothetical protein
MSVTMDSRAETYLVGGKLAGVPPVRTETPIPRDVNGRLWQWTRDVPVPDQLLLLLR